MPIKQIPVELRFWETRSKPTSLAISRTWFLFKWPTGNKTFFNISESSCDKKKVWSLSLSNDFNNLCSLKRKKIGEKTN